KQHAHKQSFAKPKMPGRRLPGRFNG
nr:Chain C, Twinfilin-1,CD2-associated protein [Mus musculus]